eukprot:799123_1
MVYVLFPYLTIPTSLPRYIQSYRQILKTIPGIYYKKEFETSEYNTDRNGHLKLLQWMFLQDCMNQNYFPNGLSKEQLDAVDTECERFIEEYCTKTIVKAHDESVQTMYKNMYRSIDFVIKKKNHASKL